MDMLFKVNRLMKKQAVCSSLAAMVLLTGNCIVNAQEEELKTLEFWGGVSVSYSGWGGLAEVDEIVASSDPDGIIEKYLSFETEEEYKNLKNGDIITLHVNYDEKALKTEGIKIDEDTYNVTVEGLPTIYEVTSYHENTAWMEC